jgi:hypothetical protein
MSAAILLLVGRYWWLSHDGTVSAYPNPIPAAVSVAAFVVLSRPCTNGRSSANLSGRSRDGSDPGSSELNSNTYLFRGFAEYLPRTAWGYEGSRGDLRRWGKADGALGLSWARPRTDGGRRFGVLPLELELPGDDLGGEVGHGGVVGHGPGPRPDQGPADVYVELH